MLVSLCLDSRRPWSELAALALRAETAGLQRVFLPDHFLPHHPFSSPPGPVHECWTTLSALASLTTRIGLGTLVLGGAYRHPAVVANMAATLDVISGGRLLLGLGAGWQPNEHTAYGIELLPAARRLDRFEEAVQVVRLLLRRDVSTFEGEYYRLREARCEPGPVQARLPLLIGAAGEGRAIPLAASYADAWHTWATPDEFRRKSSVLDAACTAVGRAPREVRRLTGQVVLVLPGTGPNANGTDVVGSADGVAEELALYRAAGVDEFIVRDVAAVPVRDAIDSLRRLTELLPRLK